MERNGLRTDSQLQHVLGPCTGYQPLHQEGSQSCPHPFPAHLTGVLSSETPAKLLDTSFVASVTEQLHLHSHLITFQIMLSACSAAHQKLCMALN